jgi:hypothetical protein
MQRLWGFLAAVLKEGLVGLNAALGWFGSAVLMAGLVAGLVVPVVVSLSYWLTVAVVLALLLAVVVTGAYRVWDKADKEKDQAVEAAKNAGGFKVISIEGNPHFSNNEMRITTNIGTPPSVVRPEPMPSAPEERCKLRDDLLVVAASIDEALSTWGERREAVAEQLGIPADQFMDQLPRIREMREQRSSQAEGRYNADCRPGVLEVCQRARAFGFWDDDIERCYDTQLGAGAQVVARELRRLAAQIPV